MSKRKYEGEEETQSISEKTRFLLYVGRTCFLRTEETITKVEFSGHDWKIVIDFPEEILRLPRLKHLSFFGLRVRRIPPAILDTPVQSLLVNTIEPPVFLIESQIEVDGMSVCQLEPFRHLRRLLLLGLGEEEKPTAWTSFLKFHRLEDPRLFLLIAEFLK